MGLKNTDLALENIASRCAKLPDVPAGAQSAFVELGSGVRAACAEARRAQLDSSVLEPDAALWATKILNPIETQIEAARTTE
jgi:hypothetical protein